LRGGPCTVVADLVVYNSARDQPLGLRGLVFIVSVFLLSFLIVTVITLPLGSPSLARLCAYRGYVVTRSDGEAISLCLSCVIPFVCLLCIWLRIYLCICTTLSVLVVCEGRIELR